MDAFSSCSIQMSLEYVFIMAIGAYKNLLIKGVVISQIGMIEVLNTVIGFCSGAWAVECVEVEDIRDLEDW